jgi:hypothetical protein
VFDLTVDEVCDAAFVADRPPDPRCAPAAAKPARPDTRGAADRRAGVERLLEAPDMSGFPDSIVLGTRDGLVHDEDLRRAVSRADRRTIDRREG